MNGKERELSLLRFENSPDGRETRRLLYSENKKRNEQGGNAALVREDTRRKCGQMVVVESECERSEEREDQNEMERE